MELCQLSSQIRTKNDEVMIEAFKRKIKCFKQTTSAIRQHFCGQCPRVHAYSHVCPQTSAPKFASCSRVCPRLTLRSVPNRHQQNFSNLTNVKLDVSAALLEYKGKLICRHIVKQAVTPSLNGQNDAKTPQNFEKPLKK